MMPIIAIIGSPNTGKSTLFNRLTATRKALVADYAGVTRDRLYGIAEIQGSNYLLIDTGGFSENKNDEIIDEIHLQIKQAIIEADLCLLVVDSSTQPSTDDLQLLNMIRRQDTPWIVLLNKSDISRDQSYSDFYQFYPDFITISASHNRGFQKLSESISTLLPSDNKELDNKEQEEDTIRIAILGRPNVGKSTLVNQLIGEKRVMALDIPGTTRDVVEIDFERKGHKFCLLDTPGVRRRAKVHHFLEKFSVLKSLQAAENCNLVIFLLDYSEGLVEQDLRLIEILKKITPAIIFAVNKSDMTSQEYKINTERGIDRRQQVFLGTNPMYISALTGSGVGKLLQKVTELHKRSKQNWPTSLLNNILQQSLLVQQPAMRGRTRSKLKFMHQQGNKPPTFIIHGNQTSKLASNYVSFLHRLFREKLKLNGICFRIIFKDTANPYHQRKQG